jgi:lipoprotein-releasing system permease protein
LFEFPAELTVEVDLFFLESEQEQTKSSRMLFRAKSFMYFRIRMKSNWYSIFFIVKKLQHKQTVGDTGVQGVKHYAKPITRIAVLSIALAMAVNILTIAVVEGFQQEVSRKVIGFGSHISISRAGELTIRESLPFLANADLEQQLKSVDGVTHVQSVAYIPAMLQSRGNTEQKEISGVILKGVDKSYDWTFFKSYLIAGKIPEFQHANSNEILISNRIAKDLHYQLGDTLNAYFVKKKPIQRQFRIVGIYETGLEDFDKELAFCYLPQVQQLNDWGISAEISIDDTLHQGMLIVRAQVNGGNGKYRYDWGKGYEHFAGFQLCPTKDTTIRLIAADYWNRIDEPAGNVAQPDYETSIADTCYLKIAVTGDKTSACFFKTDADGQLIKQYRNADGLSYDLDAGTKKIHVESFPGKGSFHNYLGAYELAVTDFDNMPEQLKRVKKSLFASGEMQQQLQAKSIQDNNKDLFTWLEFLDINLAIVLGLMLIIGIVNMGSALLVLILVRSNFIGIFKAMGANNRFLRKVFVLHVGQLIFKGMLWGNGVGILIAWLQYQFHIIPLDPKVYYLNAVPIELNLMKIIALNLITLIVCMGAMILPSFVIAKISPSKTIRFK